MSVIDVEGSGMSVETGHEAMLERHDEAGATVVHFAQGEVDSREAEATLAHAGGFPPDYFKPRYFRDHTNPVTMVLPESFGTTRPSKSRTLHKGL